MLSGARLMHKPDLPFNAACALSDQPATYHSAKTPGKNRAACTDIPAERCGRPKKTAIECDTMQHCLGENNSCSNIPSASYGGRADAGRYEVQGRQ